MSAYTYPQTIQGMTDAERDAYRRLLSKLQQKAVRNRVRETYYNGKNALKDIGYSLPPVAKDIEMVVGWPKKAVEALANRVVLDGITTHDGSELSRTVLDLMDANDLKQTAENAHTDALIHSCSFVATFKGNTSIGEPEAVIQEFPADTATGTWNRRTHGLSEALLFDVDDDGITIKVLDGYLMLPDVMLSFTHDGTTWHVTERVPHQGRIHCELLAYMPDSKRPFGRSRIDRTVMSLTDSAVRTFLRSEMQAELYSVPPRYILGADEELFRDEDGNLIPKWRVMLDQLLVIPKSPNGDQTMPQVGQFAQYSFEPHAAQLRQTALMFAAATNVPPDAMGVLTSNPSSAEAIDKAVKELCLAAESCQRRFAPAWERTIMTAQQLAGSDGAVSVRTQWRNPATPSRAAAADAAVKLVGAGILPPDSDVTYDMLDLSDEQRRTLRMERRRAAAQAYVDQLYAGSNGGERHVSTGPQPTASGKQSAGTAAQ